MIWLIFCAAMIVVAIGAFCIYFGFEDDVGFVCIFGAIFLLIGILSGFGLKISFYNNSYDTEYIPAEPLAHNQTQTVFTTDEGTYIANGLYPDGTYLLTVDGKDVLVVWQAVEGEVG